MYFQKLIGSLIQPQYRKVPATGIQILLLYANFEREFEAHSVFQTFCFLKWHGPLLIERMRYTVINLKDEAKRSLTSLLYADFQEKWRSIDWLGALCLS